MAEEVKKDEDWMQKKWRPAMGWMYMIVCMLDMAIFPVLWSVLQVLTKQPITQWNPLTLQGAGLFHLAMGAVLGIAAFGRTQEKIAGADKGTVVPPTINTPIASVTPVATPSVVSAPVVLAAPPTQVLTGYGGKTMPPPAPQPEI